MLDKTFGEFSILRFWWCRIFISLCTYCFNRSLKDWDWCHILVKIIDWELNNRETGSEFQLGGKKYVITPFFTSIGKSKHWVKCWFRIRINAWCPIPIILHWYRFTYVWPIFFPLIWYPFHVDNFRPWHRVTWCTIVFCKLYL